MLTNITKDKNRGSITIEAAIITPFVILVCLLIFTLSSIIYTHSRVQHILNQVCIELSYDSYMFDELGIVETIQEVNARSSDDQLTIEEIQTFSKLLTNEPIKETNSDLEVGGSYANPIELINSLTSSMEVMDVCLTNGQRIKDTLIEEGLYYVTTSYGRDYVKSRLEEYFLEAGLDIDFTIEHLELCNHDDSGVVIISYAYDLPFKLLEKASLKQVNSSYVQLFNGYGDYDERYHKDISTSTYGSGDQDKEDLEDEDGFYKKVYVTDHGSKYHKNPICFHIKVNAIPVPLSSVASKKPCAHCVNESSIQSGGIVFTTIGSDVYHSSPTCYSIYHNITIMSEKEALLKGLEPCGTCSK